MHKCYKCVNVTPLPYHTVVWMLNIHQLACILSTASSKTVLNGAPRAAIRDTRQVAPHGDRQEKPSAVETRHAGRPWRLAEAN